MTSEEKDIKDMKEFTPAEVMEAYKALHATVENYEKGSSEYKERMGKIEEVLDSDEFKRNQKLVGEHVEKLKVIEEQGDQIKALELEIARFGNGKGAEVNFKESPEYKALENYVRFGEKDDRFSVDDRSALQSLKSLRSDIDTAGGYLTDHEFDNVIIKRITEISPIRQVARVRIITQKSLMVPIRTGIPTVTHEGETKPGPASQSQYGSESLTPFRLTCREQYTHDLLMTSNFDLVTEINSDVAEAYAAQMGEDYVIGTGSGDKMSEGFLENAIVAAAFRETGTAGEINAADLTLLTGDLKVGYNPMYGFNRQTLALLRSLEDGAGRPIWQMNLADNVPNQINGEPYVVMQDMPAIANNSLSVVYADFMRGYLITDRAETIIIRDEVTLAPEAMVQLIFHRWSYGQVVLPEAFRLLKVKST